MRQIGGLQVACLLSYFPKLTRPIILHKSSNLLKFAVVSTASWLLIASLINLLGNTSPILFQYQVYFVSSALFGLGLGFFQDRGSRGNRGGHGASLPEVQNGKLNLMEKGWAIGLAFFSAVLLLIVFCKVPPGLATGMTITLQDPATEIFLPEYVKWRMFFDTTTIELVSTLLFLTVQIFVAPGRQLKKLVDESWRYKPIIIFSASAVLAWSVYQWLTSMAVPPCFMLLLSLAAYLSQCKNIKICGALSLFIAASAICLNFAGTGDKSFWSNGSKIDCGPITLNNKVLAYCVRSDRALYQLLPIPDYNKEEGKYIQHQTGLPENAIDFLGLFYRVMPKMQGKDALILGGGIGTETGECLKHGLAHITAVESQKWLIDLSKQQSYSPYLKPEVTVDLEDPSQFLRKSKNQYDLILYTGHTATNRSNPFIAINRDDFLYTAENLTDGFRRLKPGGQMVIATAPGDELLRVRLAANLLAITNRLDVELTTPFGNYLVVGKTPEQTGPALGLIEPLRRELGAKVVNHEHWLVERSRITPISTDDNPFVSGYAPMIPLADVFFILQTLLAMLFGLRLQTPHNMLQNVSKQKLRALLFGITFMVLICKATMIYLFEFGTSAPAIYQSITAAWLVLLIGAAASARQFVLPLWMIPAWVFRIGFAFFLVVDYSFNFGSAFFITNADSRFYVSAIMPWLPAFFAGLLSAREIADSQLKKEAFGLFVIGSSLGCLCALMSMYHGIASLDVLAGGLAALILFLMLWSQIEKWRKPVQPEAAIKPAPTIIEGENNPA